MALYSPTLWHHLTDGLSELVDHRGDTLLALADMYMRRDAARSLHQCHRCAGRDQLR